jgi:hypothetical protein
MQLEDTARIQDELRPRRPGRRQGVGGDGRDGLRPVITRLAPQLGIAAVVLGRYSVDTAHMSVVCKGLEMRIGQLWGARAATVVLCAAALAGLGPAAWAAADVEARIAAGEVVVTTRAVAGCELPEATVQAVIDAPPAVVWKLVDDCNNYKNTMIRIASSKELSRNGTTSQCQVTVNMPVPLSNLTSLSEAVSTAQGGQFKRTWKLIKGDYKRNEGSWVLAPFDAEGKRTRVTYKVLADPNVSVPNFIIRRAQMSTLPELIVKLRKAATGK